MTMFKVAAAVGGVIGALAASDDDATPLEGAIAGAAIGAGVRAWETRDERKSMIVKCMQNRQHKVAG